MPLLANGHTKSGILPASLYNSGHGTLPRGRLEHVAATCSRYELRQAAEMEVDCVKSYDHLLAGGMLETDTQGVIDSTSGSGVQQSEVSQCRLGGQSFQIFFSRTFMFLRPYDEGLNKKNCWEMTAPLEAVREQNFRALDVVCLGNFNLYYHMTSGAWKVMELRKFWKIYLFSADQFVLLPLSPAADSETCLLSRDNVILSLSHGQTNKTVPNWRVSTSLLTSTLTTVSPDPLTHSDLYMDHCEVRTH